MISYYLTKIIEAKKSNFTLESDKQYNVFSTKMELIYSLQAFIDNNNILEKEENSENFSVLAILGQVINNTYGASYQIYNTSGKYEIQEMYKHNASTIATQNGIYANISNNLNKVDTWFDKTKGLTTLFKDIKLTTNLLEKNPDGTYSVVDSKELRDFKYNFKQFMYKRFRFNINSQTFNDIILNMDMSAGVSKGKYNLKNLKNDLEKLFDLITKDVIPAITKNEEILSGDTPNIAVEPTEALGEILSNPFLIQSIKQFVDNYITKTIMTVDTLRGDKIPTFKTATLMYNDISLLQSHYKNYNKNNDKLHRSIFFGSDISKLPTESVILGTGTKLEIRDEGTESKDAANFNIIENFNTTFIFDFLKSFSKDKRNENKSFAVTIGNYSDKSTILTKFINTLTE